MFQVVQHKRAVELGVVYGVRVIADHVVHLVGVLLARQETRE